MFRIQRNIELISFFWFRNVDCGLVLSLCNRFAGLQSTWVYLNLNAYSLLFILCNNARAFALILIEG